MVCLFVCVCVCVCVSRTLGSVEERRTEASLRHVIPVVCVTNEREESVVNQHNEFRKMLYSNNETTCFGL